MNENELVLLKRLSKQLETIKKLLSAGLYANGADSEDISKITGMGSSTIRKLISRKRFKKVEIDD